MITTQELTNQIVALLTKAELSPTILSINPCAHGGNNRTYRVETADGIFAVKKYFREHSDNRDRLSAEFSFLQYAKSVIPAMVPTPYSTIREEAIALYEYIEGEKLKEADIGEREINQAAQFFCALNDISQKQKAMHLPEASEACFSIQDHLEVIHCRIQALKQFKATSPEDHAAKELVHHLNAYWLALCDKITITNEKGFDLQTQLHHAERCISPSDFGFHNALKRSDGNICFLDFEYAGWDDPAKMVGDFFSQLAVPVSPDYFDDFVQKVMTPFAEPAQLIERAKLLRSVYRIKWCCIALNIFIPVNLARRQFANPNLNVGELKKAQLLKVEGLLGQVGFDKVNL